MSVEMKDIITLDVSDEVIAQAQRIRKERDEKYDNIFPEIETDMRWSGEVGEIMTERLFSHVSKTHTNWILDDVTKGGDFKFFGLDVDVKTVKRQVPIRPWYQAQITPRHANKPVDYLLFTCYEFPVKKLHLLGVMKKEEFLQKARHYKVGEFVHKDYEIRKGREIYAVVISEMTPVLTFINQAIDQYQERNRVA